MLRVAKDFLPKFTQLTKHYLLFLPDWQGIEISRSANRITVLSGVEEPLIATFLRYQPCAADDCIILMLNKVE